MQSKSPKDYWNYIHSLNSKRKTANIDIGIFYEFFKDLNKTDNEHETDQANPDFPDINIDHELNNEITCDEILEAVQKLKSGKANGLDELSNECIKHSCDVLLHVYHKLFNIVLNTGILPDSARWIHNTNL